jgi:hypothetical protein
MHAHAAQPEHLHYRPARHIRCLALSHTGVRKSLNSFLCCAYRTRVQLGIGSEVTAGAAFCAARRKEHYDDLQEAAQLLFPSLFYHSAARGTATARATIGEGAVPAVGSGAALTVAGAAVGGSTSSAIDAHQTHPIETASNKRPQGASEGNELGPAEIPALFVAMCVVRCLNV